MSREGGDNHFISARERDLEPLRDQGRAELGLGQEHEGRLEAFLETAWLVGTRGGHAKLLNQAIREREEQVDGEWEPPVEPVQMCDIEAELKVLMETAAESLDLSVGRTIALWDLLSRAWTAGIRTYESEVMASLLERRSDVIEGIQRFLRDLPRSD